jgi:pyruvate formate lyase activating enzyme
MDIKSSLPKYAITTGCHSGIPIRHSEHHPRHSERSEESSSNAALDPSAAPQDDALIKNIRKSVNLIMNSGIDYEFRTTVCHPLHKASDFEGMGELIKGAKRYYIQNFVQSKHIDEHQKFKPFADEELQKAKKIMEKYCGDVEIR